MTDQDNMKCAVYNCEENGRRFIYKVYFCKEHRHVPDGHIEEYLCQMCNRGAAGVAPSKKNIFILCGVHLAPYLEDHSKALF